MSITTKKLLTGAVALIVLIALLIGSLYLRSWNNQANYQQTTNTDGEHGIYIIDHPEFGFKFEISDEFFSGYQDFQTGYAFSYYLPTTDPEWGQGFAKMLTVAAIPKGEADLKKAACDNDLYEQLDTPFDCLVFSHSLGENQFYYFVQLPQIEAGPADLEAKGTEQAIADALANMEIYDITQPAQELSFQSMDSGAEFDYPYFIDRALYDRADLESIGAQINLPAELDGELSYFAEKELFKLLPIEYCALSGECRPTTTNFAINLGPSGKTLMELKNSDLGSSLVQRRIGDHSVYTYEVGAEGEGIIYYFVLGPNDQMYAVALKYLNEQVVTKYSNEQSFTPFSQQKTITENIIKSLVFQVPINE